MSARILAQITQCAEQMAALVALPGPARYTHFVRRVAVGQQAWGLYQQGWALARLDDGRLVFPLWPSSEHAGLCAEYEWDDYDPHPISLEELMTELLPQLEQDAVLPGVFYTPNERGVTPSVAELLADLDEQRRLM